ncbi:MAG TPA: DUF2752 domain-containing protein [bacterium]|nr:DUF2752 domain-containing protein [bacterium]
MATELPIATRLDPPALVAEARPWWVRMEVVNPLAQTVVCAGPLVVGALFPIGVPLYRTLFGPLGAYNCLMHAITGYPCPACGLTSGVVATMHGQPALGWAYHPLGPFVVALFLLGFMGGVLKLLALKRPLPDHPAVRWLVAFPDPVLFGYLAVAFCVMYLGRLTAWLIR